MVAKKSARGAAQQRQAVRQHRQAVRQQSQVALVARTQPDRWLVYGTVPLRLFLGLTFAYAGFQKLADPGFLQPGARTYIGTQLQAFTLHSPIAFLLQWFALPAPELAGIAVIGAELAIGVLVILGLATRWAAAGGALLNFVLFLTASWTVQPYFLGSDSIYTVAWITLLLVGDQGVFTARPLVFGQSVGQPLSSRANPARRRLLLQLGGAAVGLVWVLALLPRTLGTSAAGAQATPNATQSPTPSASPGAAPSPAPTPTGTRIGTLADLRSRGSLLFTDAASGDPAVAVQLSGGSVVAFDAVCTHAGCQVEYDSSQKLLFCPCHGAEFDPAHAAAVVAGPAPTPLTSIKVTVASDGGIYAS